MQLLGVKMSALQLAGVHLAICSESQVIEQPPSVTSSPLHVMVAPPPIEQPGSSSDAQVDFADWICSIVFCAAKAEVATSASKTSNVFM